MGFLDDLFNAPTKVLCAVNGHDFVRTRGFMVCANCGHRVDVQERKP